MDCWSDMRIQGKTQPNLGTDTFSAAFSTPIISRRTPNMLTHSQQIMNNNQR